MADDVGGIDGFAAITARTALEEVSASRRATSSDDIQAARLIARVIEKAAEKLGIEYREDGGSLDEYLQRILAGAHRGGLDPVSYRIVWSLAHVPPRAEAATST